MGAYCHLHSDEQPLEWTPMSWLANGQFIADELPGSKAIMSGSDIPELDKLYHELHDA